VQHLGELLVVAAQGNQRRAAGALVADPEQVLGRGIQIDDAQGVVQEYDAG
jgi:hypothetical protein